MKIPFTKAHGAKNDFLLTWKNDVPKGGDLAAAARAICDRHTGVGADGWMIVTPPEEGGEASILLYNSDGSIPEMSGNGTRCAAALLIRRGYAGAIVNVHTGAGRKTLRMLSRGDLKFEFEMNMGRARVDAERFQLPLSAGPLDVTLLWVGNPQCVVPVESFELDWRSLGAEIEAHSQFPNRTNVSFIRRVDEHAIEARFFERGAGETMSSGTGSTGAAVGAAVRKLAASPMRVMTPAGPLELRFDSLDSDVFLSGPAEITTEGEFYLP
jgi:diaminopimelate epimerase